MSKHASNFSLRGVCEKSCFACAAKNTTEWSSLATDEIRLLNENKGCGIYLPGRLVFSQGNPCVGIYCIAEGIVALRKTDPNGKSVLVRLAKAGDTLGYRSFFGNGPYEANAEALTRAQVCFIERRVIHEMIARNSAVAFAFLERMAQDLRAAEEARLHNVALSMRERLVHLLLVLREDFGEVNKDGTLVVTLPLSRQDTAAMLGTRPETLARMIRTLEDDKVMTFKGRKVSIPDLDLLYDELEEHYQ